jgi:hypothetical protein
MTVFMKRMHALVWIALCVAGCSKTQTYEVKGTQVALGTDAVLLVTPEGGNQAIELTVKYLMPPDRARPGAKFYAVWVRHLDRAPVQLGNLQYDEKERTGALTTSTPYKSFELFVAPEKDAQPTSPGTVVVLSQQVTIK